MKLSMNWLRELVDLPEDVDEICERMTLLGLEVEAVESFELSFPGVVVGHVLRSERHPDADRLSLCRVDVGAEAPLQIVCGASNVREGLRVAVAQVGAVLPGDFKIRKSKIRGQVSMGMICSEKELGLGAGQEGILELEGEPAVGLGLDAIFGVRDTIVEIEVTPNRPDWLSHLGVARELAAWYRRPLRLPAVEIEDAAPAGWAVRIESGDDCPRFSARLLDDVVVGPSPLWMRRRLLSIGQRPINNVVDVSNYVLHECGHPNHCFDRDQLAGDAVVVRRARAGETLTTLDGQERRLGPEHLVVADAERPLALAGVMGGAASEVAESTRRLLLEVAVFDPQVIRRGRRSVQLSTDASYRFERGVDFRAVPWVSARLCGLLREVTGARVVGGRVDVIGREPVDAPEFFVRAPQARRLLGIDLSGDAMAEILSALQLPVRTGRRDGVDGVFLRPPSFRHDLLREVDALEEIARLHGFDRLETPRRAIMAAAATRGEDERFRRELRVSLAARAFHEVLGSSFQPESDLDALGLHADDARRRTVHVLNPVVQGESMLKVSAVAEMARCVERNRRRGHGGPIRLFQLARSFVARPRQVLPEEPLHLLLVWSGPHQPGFPGEPERVVDAFDVLGEVDAVLAQWGIEARRAPGAADTWMRQGSAVEFSGPRGRLGRAGQLSPSVARALDVDATVWIAEFDLQALRDGRREGTQYRPFSAYPAVRRDLSLVVPAEVRWGAVEDAARRTLGELLETCELFDVYEGKGVPEGTRVLGARLSLRSDSGTLEDAQVDAELDKLLDVLSTEHEIRLRS